MKYLMTIVISIGMISSVHAGDLLDALKRIQASRADNPEVIVYYAPFHMASAVLREGLEEVEDLNLVWDADIPDWVNVESLPVIHFEKGGEWLSRRSGEGAPLTLKYIRESVFGKRYLIQMSEKREWSFGPESTIESHLMGPNHLFEKGELKGFTRRQLIKIHNFEHDHERPRTRAGPSTANVAKRSKPYCPT